MRDLQLYRSKTLHELAFMFLIENYPDQVKRLQQLQLGALEIKKVVKTKVSDHSGMFLKQLTDRDEIQRATKIFNEMTDIVECQVIDYDPFATYSTYKIKVEFEGFAPIEVWVGDYYR